MPVGRAAANDISCTKVRPKLDQLISNMNSQIIKREFNWIFRVPSNICNISYICSEMQQRIPNEVLSGLATAIASGHIYEIVRGLTEVQQLEEKSLFHQRLELLRKHSGIYIKPQLSMQHRVKKCNSLILAT